MKRLVTILAILTSLIQGQMLQDAQILQWEYPGTRIYDLTMVVYRPHISGPEKDGDDIYGEVYTYMNFGPPQWPYLTQNNFSFPFVGYLPTDYNQYIRISNSQYGANPQPYQMLNGQPITGELWGWESGTDACAFAATVWPGMVAGRFPVAQIEIPISLSGVHLTFWQVGWYLSDTVGFTWFGSAASILVP